ncbi:MAG: cytoplasmic protein [Desulfatiglandales bacterium]
MPQHSHHFVEKYDGLVGFGFNREIDEYTLTVYLQKFSDDDLVALIRSRMSTEDLETLFSLLARLLTTYLSEEEYHAYFLKDRAPEDREV